MNESLYTDILDQLIATARHDRDLEHIEGRAYLMARFIGDAQGELPVAR